MRRTLIAGLLGAVLCLAVVSGPSCTGPGGVSTAKLNTATTQASADLQASQTAKVQADATTKALTDATTALQAAVAKAATDSAAATASGTDAAKAQAAASAAQVQAATDAQAHANQQAQVTAQALAQANSQLQASAAALQALMTKATTAQAGVTTTVGAAQQYDSLLGPWAPIGAAALGLIGVVFGTGGYISKGKTQAAGQQVLDAIHGAIAGSATTNVNTAEPQTAAMLVPALSQLATALKASPAVQDAIAGLGTPTPVLTATVAAPKPATPAA